MENFPLMTLFCIGKNMSTRTKIQNCFPADIQLPEPIGLICDFLDEHGYPISGCFEIRDDGNDALRGWFRNDQFKVDLFATFGSGADGSIYALWLEPNRNPNQAPVVMLGSEGQLEVLASTATEFVSLLCLGYDEIGYDDVSEIGSEWEETRRFREWVLGKMDLEIPGIGKAIVDKANQLFPNFEEQIVEYEK